MHNGTYYNTLYSGTPVHNAMRLQRQSYSTHSLTHLLLKGSRVGAVVKALASHQSGPDLIPGLDVICGLSLFLVLYSAPRAFSPGTPFFPYLQKSTFPNSECRTSLKTTSVSGASWVNIMIDICPAPPLQLMIVFVLRVFLAQRLQVSGGSTKT